MSEALVWLGIMAVLLLIEALTAGLTTIWFAGGALIAGITAFAGGALILQILLFFVVSLVLLIFTRPVALRMLNKKVEPTNVDTMIGKSALVTQSIDNLKETGQVVIGGIEWTARSAEEGVSIPKEAIVEVIQVQGVKLLVKMKKEG